MLSLALATGCNYNDKKVDTKETKKETVTSVTEDEYFKGAVVKHENGTTYAVHSAAIYSITDYNDSMSVYAAYGENDKYARNSGNGYLQRINSIKAIERDKLVKGSDGIWRVTLKSNDMFTLVQIDEHRGTYLLRWASPISVGGENIYDNRTGANGRVAFQVYSEIFKSNPELISGRSVERNKNGQPKSADDEVATK